MIPWLDEVRWALRRLLATPGSTIAAALVLGFGIGSLIVVFTVFRAVLLEDLPLHQPDELVLLERQIGDETVRFHSPADLFDLRETVDGFQGVAAGARFRAVLAGSPEGGIDPARVVGLGVTPEYFEILGASPVLGQVFRSGPDGLPLEPDAAVVSWELWRTGLGADRSIVGERIMLDEEAYRVVAVLPPSLAFLGVDLWVQGPRGLPKPPFPAGPDLLVRRDLAYLTILARGESGKSLEALNAAVERAGEGMAEAYPAGHPAVRYSVVPFHDLVTARAEDHLLPLLVAVGLVFALVCLNIAGLLLARRLSQADADAVKLALGASRRQIWASAFAESLVLATAGGLLALLLAGIGLRVFLALAPGFPRIEEASLDPTALLFAGGLVVVASLAGTLASLPGISSRRARETVARGGHQLEKGGRKVLWRGLLGLEIAGMVVLLVGGLTLGYRLVELRSLELGFDPENLVSFSLQLPRSQAGDPAVVAAFFDELLERLAAIPEAESVGATAMPPLEEGRMGLSFTIPGRSVAPAGPAPTADFSTVSEGYFATLGTRVERGRVFGPDDRAGSPPVAVINRSMAERYWPRDEAVGSSLQVDGELVEVVGVVSDVRYRLQEREIAPRVYRPLGQSPRPVMTVLLRGPGESSRWAERVRGVVHEIDPRQPVSAVVSLEEALASVLQPTRYLVLVFGTLALLAVALVAVGLYGLLAFRVREEETELAVRMALGAPRGWLVWGRVLEGLKIAVGGIGLGFVGVVASAGLVERLLAVEVVTATPRLVLVAVLLALVVVAVTSLVPALAVYRLSPGRVVAQP